MSDNKAVEAGKAFKPAAQVESTEPACPTIQAWVTKEVQQPQAPFEDRTMPMHVYGND